MRSLNSLPTDGKANLRDVNDMTAKLLFVLFLLLPISISCKEKSCEDVFYEFVHKKNDGGYIVLETGNICLYKNRKDKNRYR